MLTDSSLEAWQKNYDEEKKSRERTTALYEDYKKSQRNRAFSPGDKVWYRWWSYTSDKYYYNASVVIRKSYVPFSNEYIIETGYGTRYKVNWDKLTEIGRTE